tara:strand:+ start:41 stop:313 length:273 start_codon:yes stop_codon:yes gene_type:complete
VGTIFKQPENVPLPVNKDKGLAGKGLVNLGTCLIAGGIPEVVRDGVSGILVRPKDPYALHDAIVELLDDKVKQKLMGFNGNPSSMRKCNT